MSDYSFAIFIVLGISFLLLNTSIRSTPRKYMAVELMMLVILAFFIDPVGGYEKHGDYIDLYRFFYHLDTLKTYGWNVELDYMQEYKAMPVVKLVLYIISLIGVNQILPALGCLVGYGFFARTIRRIGNTLSCRPALCSLAFFLFVACNNYVNLISNLRFPVGLVIYFYILYKDIVDKEKFVKCLVGYILLCGVHSIFLAFLGFRIILALSNKYSMWIICAISFIAGLALNLGIASSINVQTSNALINNVIYKIAYYTREDISGHTDTLYFLMTIVRILCLIICLLKARKELSTNKCTQFRQMYDFSILVIFVMIGASWNFHLFTRIGHLILMLDIMWFMLIEDARYAREKASSSRTTNRLGTMTGFEVFWLLFTVYHILYLGLSHAYRMAWF